MARWIKVMENGSLTQRLVMMGLMSASVTRLEDRGVERRELRACAHAEE
jgi:hypothetical protein